MLKRITTLFILIGLVFTFSNSKKIKAANFVMTNIEQPIHRTFDGTTNVERFVEIEYHKKSKSRFNVLEFDNNDEDIHVVSMSNYSDFAWGTSTLEGMIYSFELANPHLEVLGGVNGDFFDINNTKRPSGVFVQDYEVLRGRSTRPVFNVRSDRTFDIGVPKRLGLEVLVIDNNNEIKYRELVDKHNKETNSKDELGIYFENYESINNNYDYVVIEAQDIKYVGSTSSTNLEFAKGNVDFDLKIDDLDERKFVIMIDGIKDVITQNDTVIIQSRLEGYENVRATSGGNRILIQDGIIPQELIDSDDYNVVTAQHPRTIVGIREDGSLFFVVNNGRDEKEDVPGLSSQEQAFLMKELGAYNALNLDGGGSSTMMARNFDGTFEVLNKLSDGNMRSVSTVLLIVRGDVKEQPINIEGVDNRETFTKPTNLYVDFDNNLTFDSVDMATRYIVTVGDNEYETSKTNFSLNSFKPGEYNISVRVKGNMSGKTSLESDILKYQVKEKTTNEILE